MQVWTPEERLRRIAKLHLREEREADDAHCVHCDWLWPCPTVQFIPDDLAVSGTDK